MHCPLLEYVDLAQYSRRLAWENVQILYHTFSDFFPFQLIFVSPDIDCPAAYLKSPTYSHFYQDRGVQEVNKH